ncbi:MAG: type VI secretion system protein TssA [Candidatus Competibacteraceae bacterium]|nr:type VI secretion system protein TssA [Candidatus Competibacteraceae bacterium]
MSAIDVPRLLEEISPDQPCGEDLEYDAGYIEMEQAAQGKPEQQFGDTLIPAEEPNWRQVRDKALELLARSRDLRVIGYLNRALVRTDGLQGLADGLALLRGVLEQHWDHLHPQLDPEDDYDPTMRVNAIASLCDQALLRALREAPLARSRALGSVSLRDIEVATGQAPAPPGVEPMEPATVEAVFQDADPASLQAVQAAVDNSLDHLRAVEALLMERVGPEQAPDLEALPRLLKTLRAVLAERLGGHDPGQATEPDQDSAPVSGAQTAAPATGGVASQIASREDVVRMLDKLCEYFARHEPTSPVPLLLRRARRLVHMDFMEIIQDLAPDGINQVETIRGPDPQASSEDEG